MDGAAARRRWRAVAESLDFALQPIIDIRTGSTFGYEALLRGWEGTGHPSIHALFDAAHDELALYCLDLCLRRKALAKFASIPDRGSARLFYNIDNRVLEMPDYTPGNTSWMLSRHGLPLDALCFEISERHQFTNYSRTRIVLDSYRRQEYLIALDDYGAGYSGLQLLYHCEPHFLKIDRFFIQDVDSDERKRTLASAVTAVAHGLGVVVIAEGVETEGELEAARGIGCDLAQGYLIQRPTTDVRDLRPCYPLGADRGVTSSC